MKEYLKTIYDSVASIGRVGFDPYSFDQDVTVKLSKFNRDIRIRDAGESIGALVIFTIELIHLLTANQTLVQQIGDVIVLLSCLFVAYVLYSVRRFSVSAYSLPVIEYVQHQRIYLIKQKRLLDTVFWWYMLPFCAGILLPVLYEFGVIETILQKGLLLLFGVVIYILNKRAAKSLQPLIEEVDDFVKDAKEAD